MSTAFARALPQAKLTTHDPRIVQVVTAPKAYLTRGDIGAKSNIDAMMNDARLGRTGNVRYVQVRNLDNPNGTGLEWKEREHQVILLEQWREGNYRTFSEHENRFDRRYSGFEALSTSEGSYSSQLSSQPELRKNVKLPFVSRYDRASTAGKSAPTTPTRTSQDPNTKDAPAVVPHYSLMSEAEFQKLLTFVRDNRDTFLEQKVQRFAQARRFQKYQRALRKYHDQEDRRRDEAMRGVTPPQDNTTDAITIEPILEDFPLEPELTFVRAALNDATSSSSTSSDELDPLVNPFDLFNLARTTDNVEMASFLETIFARNRVDNPSSIDMPHATTESSSMPKNPGTRLHPVAGLQFSRPDRIFADHLAKAVPAHVLGTDDPSRTKIHNRYSGWKNDFLVAVGSRLLRMPRSSNYGASELDWARQNKNVGSIMAKLSGDATFRTSNTQLSSLPAGQLFSGSHARWDRELESLNLGYIQAELRNDSHAVAMANNRINEKPYKNVLGSRDWNANSNQEVKQDDGRTIAAGRQFSEMARSGAAARAPRGTSMFDGINEPQEDPKPTRSRLQMSNRNRAAYQQRSGAAGFGFGPGGAVDD